MLDKLASMRQSAASQAQSLGLQAISSGADPTKVTAMVAELSDRLMNLGLSYDMTTEAQFANALPLIRRCNRSEI